MVDLSPADLKLEQKRILRSSLYAGLVVAAVFALSFFVIGPHLAFPEALADRLGFALQANVVLALVLIVAVQRVSSGRYRSAVDNRGSAFGQPSERIAVDVAFLQNTLEQTVIAVVIHLAFAATVSGSMLIFIPSACCLFVAGRIAFRLGYPYGAGARAFGMALTALPSLVGAASVVWLCTSDWLT